MEIRPDFAKRVEALSSSTPREAIANLLSALMPRVPAATRAATSPGSLLRDATPAPPEEFYKRIEDAMVARVDPMAKLTKGRKTRAPKSKRYTVLEPDAHMRHKRSWRRYMVQAVVSCANQTEAEAWLAAYFPLYADKGVDVAWCEQQGYIKF